MDVPSEIKALIKGQDIRGIRDFFFKSDIPELRSGFFREDQWWDYKEDCPGSGKSTDSEWAKIAADVAAFHNQEGGIFFFGIGNKDFRFLGAKPRLDTSCSTTRFESMLATDFG
jgi:hypothetical protein